jgi:hypothetical protein
MTIWVAHFKYSLRNKQDEALVHGDPGADEETLSR